MKFGLLDGGEDSEYNGDGFVEISIIFVIQDAFIFGMVWFEWGGVVQME